MKIPSLSGNQAQVGLTRSGSVLVAVLVTVAVPGRSAALEVFLNTNSPATVSRGTQFFDMAQWKEAAKAVDGIWYVGQGMTKPPEGRSISKVRHQWIKDLRDKQWTVELQGRVTEAMGKGTHGTVHEVKAMKDAGVQGFSAMVFREDRNKDSTLTVEDVAAARAGMKAAGVPNTPIIVNTRAFRRNTLLQNLIVTNLVDGFSLEVASNRVRKGTMIESELVPAVQFAVRQKKAVYLLITAEHSKDMLGDVQDIVRRLVRNAPREMGTPNVRIVLSSYAGSGSIHFTPERDKQGGFANTTSGAALWLCTEADRFGLRNAVARKQR